MKELICQSCSMPLEEEEFYGTEENGERTDKYCIYCYESGKFTSNTIEEQLEACLEAFEEDKEDVDLDYMKEHGIEYLSKLDRWNTK